MSSIACVLRDLLCLAHVLRVLRFVLRMSCASCACLAHVLRASCARLACLAHVLRILLCLARALRTSYPFCFAVHMPRARLARAMLHMSRFASARLWAAAVGVLEFWCRTVLPLPYFSLLAFARAVSRFRGAGVMTGGAGVIQA